MLEDEWRQNELGRSIEKNNRSMSNGALRKLANAKRDMGGVISRPAVACAENPCFLQIERRYAAESAGCHDKWDKLIGFAVALAMHSLLFLGLWRHGKVHAPAIPTTVSIVYLGPSEQGKAGGVDAPKAIRLAPAKQRPTRRDSPISAKPTVSTVRVPAPAAEAAPPAEVAPARQMVEPTGVPGMASSPTASGSTNVGHSAAVVQATQSVLLSGELSVSCSERTTPAYPKLSLRLGEQGRTLLLVELDERGRVANVSVKSGSGFPRLDEAAVSAVRSWRCTPAMRDGVAVRAVAMQPFNFALTGH